METKKINIIVPRSGCSESGTAASTTSIIVDKNAFPGSLFHLESSFARWSATARQSSSPGWMETDDPGTFIHRLAPPTFMPTPGISGSQHITQVNISMGALNLNQNRRGMAKTTNIPVSATRSHCACFIPI
jgi:hypothetical protein